MTEAVTHACDYLATIWRLSGDYLATIAEPLATMTGSRTGAQKTRRLSSDYKKNNRPREKPPAQGRFSCPKKMGGGVAHST